MNDRIKETFEKIHADETLKTKTKAYLIRKTKGYAKRPVSGVLRLAPVALFLLFLLVGSGWVYYHPTASISIEVNPSVELEINRFDKVIAVRGYNRDGEALADSLDIKYADCSEAVLQILNNKNITALLSQDEFLTITVAGSGERQCARILSQLESCTDGHENTRCYSSTWDERSTAHEMDLSCGRYHAYLELKSLDPTVTPEEVRSMTMKEIYDLIDELSQNQGGSYDTSNENGRGYGHGHGQKYGTHH
ncbi:MAG: anti-sigma-I factor RsgI family protein [Ruminococcus sp.]